MTKKFDLNPQMSIADLLHDWPQAIPVFIKYRMACVGCSMSSFETLDSAASIYRIPPDELFKEITEAIVSGAASSNGKGGTHP